MTDYNITGENNKDFSIRISQIISSIQQIMKENNNEINSIPAEQKIKYFNLWADYWRYVIGVNVIPADTKNKKTSIEWSQYQNSPISEEQHDKWKQEGAFNNGIAIIAGKVWHNCIKMGLFLILVDLDNQKAIDEFCARNGIKTPLNELAKSLIIEQHKDQPCRAHIMFYATRPFHKKSSDVVALSLKQNGNDIPAIEVKGAGEHGLLFCSPSLHKNGYNYQIIEGGVLEPHTVDELEGHIDNICKKYGIVYLDSTENKKEDKVSVQNLFKGDTIIYQGHNRHEALLRVMESLIFRNKAIIDSKKIRELARDWNRKHCVPPLDKYEENKQWHDAVKFVEIQMKIHSDLQHKQMARLVREQQELLRMEEKRQRDEARKPLSVAKAAILNEGTHHMRGLISMLSERYKMVRGENIRCPACKSVRDIIFERPIAFSEFKKIIAVGMCATYFNTTNCDGFVKSKPLPVNAVNIELRDLDSEQNQNLNKLRFILFEDDTKEVGINEIVTITGNIYIQQTKFRGKDYPVVYAQKIKYENREQTELTTQDVKAIKRFIDKFLGPEDRLIKQLVGMTACGVVGCEDIKEGLLMSLANSKPDSPEKRSRIHIAIIGPPGLAKTKLVMYATKLIRRSSFDTCQTSTGLSLLAIVDKSEDNQTLRLGPVSSSIFSALDEVNRLTSTDQEKLFGVMQEGYFTSNKFGQNDRITAPVTIAATVNPPMGVEPDAQGRLDLNQLNIIPPLLDRFDLKFYIKPPIDEKERRKRAYMMAQLQDQAIPDYSPFLKKYLLYIKQINPALSPEARSIITEYFIHMEETNINRGAISARRLDVLFNMARSRARLQAKSVADRDDALATVEFYSEMMDKFEYGTIPPTDPIESACNECATILSESTLEGQPIPYSLEHLLKCCCERNDQVDRYLHSGTCSQRDVYRIDANKLARNVYDKLVSGRFNVQRIGKRPIKLVYESRTSDHSDHSDQKSVSPNKVCNPLEGAKGS